MPKVACPKCNKVYNVPDEAVGQVATCKCGHKFRLGKRKATPSPAPVVEVPEPAKTHDSFWDDALDEPVGGPDLAGAASLVEPEAARPLAPIKHKMNKRKKRGGKEPWQVALDIGFRIVAFITPFVVWWMTYESFKKMEWREEGDALVYSTVIFLVALVFGVVLAKHGIGFDRGSMQHRLTGLGLMVGGILVCVISIGLTIAMNMVLGGFIIVVASGCVIGVIIFFIGMLQFVSGRDISSESTFTRDVD